MYTPTQSWLEAEPCSVAQTIRRLHVCAWLNKVRSFIKMAFPPKKWKLVEKRVGKPCSAFSFRVKLDGNYIWVGQVEGTQTSLYWFFFSLFSFWINFLNSFSLLNKILLFIFDDPIAVNRKSLFSFWFLLYATLVTSYFCIGVTLRVTFWFGSVFSVDPKFYLLLSFMEKVGHFHQGLSIGNSHVSAQAWLLSGWNNSL